MKDNTFPVESVKKLLRRGATSHLHDMLREVRPAGPAEPFKRGLLAFFGRDARQIVSG